MPQQSDDVRQVEQGLVVAKGIIVIDRTGSMGVTRSTGNTRCYDAREQGLKKVDEFFGKYSGSALAVWTIDSTVKKLTGYVTSPQAAKDAITALTPQGCSGSTPLADGICMAVDELNKEPKVAGVTNLVTILSDGGENASQGACKGNSNDLNDPASWRYKARQKAFGSSPHVQINPQYWTGSLDFLSLVKAQTQNLEPVPVVSAAGVSAQGVCTNDAQCDHDLFLSLAADTGGLYDLVKDSNPQYPCSSNTCPAPYYEPIFW
ncbi:MAG TPA: VWA domain-containing protein [Archangium sp.]|nr:VWA domain-containing protein [Archangium sp.]